jgi:anti-anti-sigma regulatory factor
MPAFQILKEKLPEGVILLTVRGFLDAHTFEELERTINDIFEEGTYKLIVDLSGVD